MMLSRWASVLGVGRMSIANSSATLFQFYIIRAIICVSSGMEARHGETGERAGGVGAGEASDCERAHGGAIAPSAGGRATTGVWTDVAADGAGDWGVGGLGLPLAP